MCHVLAGLVSVCAAILSIYGCSSSTGANDPVVCTALAAAGLSVTVVDSVSGQLLPVGASVIATSGAYADTAHFPVNPYPLAYEHRGTFTVTVNQPGYRTWQKSGVIVTGDQCHVTATQVTARMIR